MDKLMKYRDLIKQILTRYVEFDNRHPNPEIEHLLITDDEHGHYIWLNLGWSKGERLNSPTIHVRLKDGKIWIEEDWTDIGIANQLLEAGVPREDIVLALHAPEMRQYTEFAAA
ncbi:MAG: XisI protein [Blastocatellia bacterium]